MSIRLLVADDHPVVQAGIASLVSAHGIQVVAQASGGNEALALVAQNQPDVVLLDVRMSAGDGLTCLTQLKQQHPELPVLMFSGFRNPTFIARANALGASGYLLKTVSGKDLVSAIVRVAEGQTLWTGEELRRIKGTYSSVQVDGMLEIPLTKRESEVLKQLALGLSNKEIAQALSISYETVKEHVQHVLRKLGVSDRTQAAVWAVRNGVA